MTSDRPCSIEPWITLKGVPGIGNHLFKRLIERFRQPENVFDASHASLLQVEGMNDRLARAVRAHRLSDIDKRELDLLTRKGYGVVTMSDPGYPMLLTQIPDPPPFLYVYGVLENTIRTVAVVGSRNATSYGITITRRLCADLASLEMVVVSGMARGIDTAAHVGALDGKGKTIAVLGSGLERVYPAENRKLFHQIAENGAVVSEFPLLTEPESYNFPVRNRIISGMSLGVVIVEATKRSGSLITARLAAEQNREVFAVPGSVHSFKSTGTHTLIKQGAKLVEHAKDILEEFSHLQDPVTSEAADRRDPALKERLSLSSEESRILETLDAYPVHIDELVRKTGMAPGKLSGILIKLEIKGIVQQSPGKLFSISGMR
jgi:DNA processing protein